MLRFVLLWVTFWSVCSASVSSAQEVQRIDCRSCEHRGLKDCKRHKSLLGSEQSVTFCSEAAACSKCSGVLQVDCKECDNQAALESTAARRALVHAWRVKRAAQAEQFTQSRARSIMHIETPHLSLAFSARPLTVGKRKLDNHQAMHLYAERIESLRTQFMTLFELEDDDFLVHDSEAKSPRLNVWIVRDRKQLRSLAPRVAGMNTNGSSVKRMGERLVYAVHHDKALFRDDAALHRNVTHIVSHLLLSSVVPVGWMGNRGLGWIDEGVAHYFEYRIGERCTNFCYEEVSLARGAGYQGGKWRSAVRKLVEAGKLRNFVDFYRKNSDELDFQERAQAFAVVEFLINRFGGPKFISMVKAVQADVDTRQAMRDAFGLGPLEVDAALIEWVTVNY